MADTAYGNRLLREILVPKKEGGGWRKVRYGELHNFYS
jgi:hypothetical protein